MVRPAFVVFVVVAFAAPAHTASELPRRMGMYPQQGAALAMLDSKVSVRVRGPIAEAIVTQTFRNDTDRVTEATYIFPLPADAAVSAMEIESGTRTIRASIESREQAQQRYERAIAAGVGAGLLDQERPDVFTQTVSAIPARGTVTVTLRFDTVARYSSGTWELVLPMVVAPRYVPGTASGRPTTGTGRAPDTERSPDASRVTPRGAPGVGGKTEVAIEFGDVVEDVTSPTHELAKATGGYLLTDPKTDHDALIRWRAKVPAAGWVEASDDGGGFAAVVIEAPPGAATRKTSLRVMLVLDRAATTKGDADAVKRPLVRALLASLGPKDRAAVTGSDTLDFRAPDQVARTLEENWHKAAGAHDLSKVLAATRSDGAPIVLVGDGLVADDRAVLAAAVKVGVPIHVIGVGPAPNRSLLGAIAMKTGGTVRFAAIGDDVTTLARDVLADAAAPPELLSVNWGTLAASDVVPATLPRLGAGQAVLVVAKVKKVQAANARVRGDVFGFVTVKASPVPDGATTARGSLARRWAKLKLDELIAAGDARAISQHALRYGLVSPYTSMVAIGDEVVVQGGVKHSVPVPVSVPEGMQWQQVKREITVDTTVSTKLRDEQPSADKVAEKPFGGEEKPKHKTAPKPKKEKSPEKSEPTPKPAEPSRVYDYDRNAGDAEGEADDERTNRRTLTQDTARNAPVAAGSIDAAPAPADDEEDAAESLSISSESGSRRRRARLSLSLGAGLSVINRNAAPIAGLSTRLEIGGRTLYGAEGSLWLVDGLDVEGSVLATITRRGLFDEGFARRLELGAGIGARITGDSAGPALNLTLRTRLRRGFATYLRYDGALLLHDKIYDGQNAGSFGLEATW